MTDQVAERQTKKDKRSGVKILTHVPAKPPSTMHLNIRLLDENGNPLAGKNCELFANQTPPFPTKTARTTDKGILEVDIVRPTGPLFITVNLFAVPDNDMTFEIKLGPIADANLQDGARMRLSNLGYLASPSAALDDVTRAAQRFQAANGIVDANGNASGKLDTETVNRLKDAHDAGGPLVAPVKPAVKTAVPSGE